MGTVESDLALEDTFSESDFFVSDAAYLPLSKDVIVLFTSSFAINFRYFALIFISKESEKKCMMRRISSIISTVTLRSSNLSIKHR